MTMKPETPPSGIGAFVCAGDDYPTWSPERRRELAHAADEFVANFWAENSDETVEHKLRVLYDLITER